MHDENKNSGQKYLTKERQTTGASVQQSYPRWSTVFDWENYDPNTLPALNWLNAKYINDHIDRKNQQERSTLFGRIHSIQITHHSWWSSQTEQPDLLDRAEGFQHFFHELHPSDQWWNTWLIQWDWWTLANWNPSKNVSSEYLRSHYSKLIIQTKSIRYQRWRKQKMK